MIREAVFAVGIALTIYAPAMGLPLQEHELGIEKGDIVTLKIPASLFVQEGVRIWDGTPIYVVTASAGQNGLAVSGQSDWMMAGFPSGIELRVEKVEDEDEYTELELRNSAANVKIRFSRGIGNLSAALRQVVALGGAGGAEMTDYVEQAYDSFAYFLFTGPLAEIPPDAQREILIFAHITAEGTGVSHEEFRGDDYLAINLGTDPNVYNNLQLDQAQRIAKILNDRLLTTLKAFAEPVRDVPAVHGIKFDILVGHKSFLDQNALPEFDAVRVYASSEDIKAFADFDLTSQEFVDRCFVIVDDNRISVPLSSGG